jgi:S1-C subfamily serine protease
MKQASRAAALVASAAIGAAGDSVKLTVLAGTGTHQITVTLGSVP